MKRSAFADLALSYLDEVTAFAYHLTDEEWEAEDLVQSTYAKAFAGHDALVDPATCRAWLFRIARNHWYDKLRARKAGPALELINPNDPAAPRATVRPSKLESWTQAQLERALEHLPMPQREAVVLCDLWGFTYREIAEILEVPIGTVRSRISRGRDALMGVLSDDTSSGKHTGETS